MKNPKTWGASQPQFKFGIPHMLQADPNRLVVSACSDIILSVPELICVLINGGESFISFQRMVRKKSN